MKRVSNNAYKKESKLTLDYAEYLYYRFEELGIVVDNIEEYSEYDIWGTWALLQDESTYKKQKMLIWSLYNSELKTKNIMQKIDCFLASCTTLINAECQEEAYEKQKNVYRSRLLSLKSSHVDQISDFEETYWKKDLPDDFFDELYCLKQEYPCSTSKLDLEEIWVANCKSIWKTIKSQPISSMMVPLLLTLFIVDYPETPAVYPMLKYKKQRQSKIQTEKVRELYQKVKEKVMTYLEDPCIVAFPPYLPEFGWGKLINNFSRKQGLTRKERAEAGKWFRLYLKKNGLSKQQEKELAQCPYGKNLRSLAKLCNLNIFLTIRSGAKIPPKAREPLRLLQNDKLISCRSSEKCKKGGSIDDNGWKILSSYLRPYYHEAFNLPDIGLMRYFRFSLEPSNPAIDSSLFDIYDKFRCEIENKIQTYNARYLKLQCKDRGRFWEGAQNVRDLRLAKAFSDAIYRNFNDEDYKDVIKHPGYTINSGFPAYLKIFCDKYHVNKNEQAQMSLRLYLEYEAYKAILRLTYTYLLSEYIFYWSEIISNVLFDGLSGGDSYKRE